MVKAVRGTFEKTKSKCKDTFSEVVMISFVSFVVELSKKCETKMSQIEVED